MIPSISVVICTRNRVSYLRLRPAVVLWMGSAFCAALVLAAVVLAVLGTDERGTRVGLKATARLSFLLFWPAYSGSALTALFGATFEPLKQRARDFGLAFAAAHLVHLGLVGWLCWIGAVPSARTFIIFGIAVIFTYMLALFSFGNLQRALGPRAWWFLRVVGMNYILYAFFVDFRKTPLQGGITHVVEYLPFVTLAIAGPLLRIAAWTMRLRHRLP